MRPWSSLPSGVLALALVAHLWMLDVPAGHEEALPPDLVAASQSHATMTCSTGMAACKVTMPVEAFALALVLLASVARAWSDDDTWSRRPEPWGIDRPERAPPRPAVPASVVLLE